MKIVFIGYNYLPQYTSPQQLINRIKPSVTILGELSRDNSVSYVRQIGYIGNYSSNGVDYYFLDTGKKSLFPHRVHLLVKKLNPDVVIIPGFHFPLQVIQLRWVLPKKVKIILEYHADKPLKGFKKKIQRIADKSINAYFFTSLGNANEWIDEKIIHTIDKCFEISANSSYFSRLNKQQCKQRLGMNSEINFLWVGRLNKNKDPLLVVQAFERFLSFHQAQLHFIYQKDDLLTEIEDLIKGSLPLQRSVVLHGEISHDKLAEWYSAADFFISASHTEGGSIALLEAMACGCIPIVTSIPSALKVIEDGRYGLYFEPGNSEQLFEKLESSVMLDKEKLARDVERHFKESLSAQAIAKRFALICEELISK